MNQHKQLTSFIVLCCLAATSFCQVSEIPPALATKLADKKKYVDVMKEVDNYYKLNNFNNDPKLFKEYKRWNRWAWLAARHLNAAGEVEYKTNEYFNDAGSMAAAMQSLSANSNAGNWVPVGPTSTTWGTMLGSRGIGRIDKLIIHPTNPQVLLAGSPAGGLWRTDNGGNSWQSISPTVPNCGVAGIVFGNNDPTGNTIYMLTGDSFGLYFLSNFRFNANSLGVLVTYNGGTTWSQLGNSATVLKDKTPFKLLQVRNFPNVFLVATSNGLYASYNFGINWAQVPFTFQAFDIEQHPTNDAIIYYSGTAAVGVSTDFGQSFGSTIPVYNPTIAAVAIRSQLAVTPANPNEVYYLQCGTAANSNTIYKSVDNGGIFTRINTQNLIVSAPWYNYAFAVNPANNNLMAAAGFSLTSSTNNGNSFANVTIGNTPSPIPNNYLHADIHDLAFTPNGNLLYAATDGGVAVSSDNGVTWADMSNNLQCTQYYRMEGFEGTENLYIGGTQDNGTHYTTNGSSMVYAGTGDGFACDFVNTNSNIFFMVENTAVFRFQRSTNTRTPVSPPVASPTFFPDVICHPTNANIVYVGYASGIWRSVNQGTSWTQISTTGTNDGSTGGTRNYNGGFAVSAQLPDRLYAATGNTISRSDDQGTTWITISGTTGWPANFGTVTDIATRSNNASEVWITTTGNNGANRIIYSSNAGASWVDFTGSLPNVPVYSIFYTTDGDAYVGTELGVYFMDFSMNDWLPFYNGLPMIPVTDLFVNEAAQSISAGTLGRGIWRSGLYSDCSLFLTLSSNVEGKFFYQTNGVLQSTQNMSGSVGNELRYRTPTKISLKNGFKAKDGSYLHAVIGPCGQGVLNRVNDEGNAMVVTKTEALNTLKK